MKGVIFIPIFQYECEECGHQFENIEVWSNHRATECTKCKSPKIHKIITAHFVQMDVDAVKHSLPDPVPPLREAIGKTQPGYEGGFKDLDKRELKEYTRHKDKLGNTVWLPKKREYFYSGRASRRSSAERND